MSISVQGKNMENKTQPQNLNFCYTAHIEVRYAETDAMGVVHHATYPIWFEQARTEIFRFKGFPYSEMEKQGFASPVLQLQVEYKQSCRYGDMVDVEIAAFREDKLKMRFYYKVSVQGKICATGNTLHIFTKQGRPTRETPAGFNEMFPLEG